MKTDVVVILLAGGEGKRFWPITTSKNIFSYPQGSLLYRNLLQLEVAGFRDVIVVVQPCDVESIRQMKFSHMQIEPVVQHQPTGMSDGVLTAADKVGSRSVLVMNAQDVVAPELFQELYRATLNKKEFIVGKEVSTYIDAGYLQIQHDRVIGIVEKPGEGNQPSPYVNLVFHHFLHFQDFEQILRKIKSTKDDVYELALTQYLENHDVEFIKYTKEWYPHKFPWHILDITQYMLQSIHTHKGKNVTIKPHVVIEGPVYIGDNVKIFEFTKIVGPVYIGDNTIIGNNNIIRDSYIGKHCVTGYSTDITRSYIGDWCWFHTNYIGDSVLEENVSLGSGTVLANLRLDEGEITSLIHSKKINTHRNKLGSIIGKNVRIGVNTSIMPGTKIGSESFIGAGLVIDKDVLNGSFISERNSRKQNSVAVPHGSRTLFRQKV